MRSPDRHPVPPPLTFTPPTPPGLDLGPTLGSLRVGESDPCWRTDADGSWTWATRTPEGAVTLQLHARDGAVVAQAWGPGAEWSELLLPGLVGVHDDPSALVTDHDPVASIVARYPGFRLARSARVADAAVAGVCRRGVSSFEAARSWALLVEAMGDDAPGPGGLRLPAAPRRVAAADPYELHVLGLEHQRADEVRRIASHASRLELSTTEPGDAVVDRLRNIAGVGADAIDHVRSVALGQSDALPVIDAHHLAALVRVLQTDDRSADAEILLEAFRPQRGRVVRLIGLAAEEPLVSP